MKRSPALSIASLPAEERAEWIRSLSPQEAEALRWCWEFWARPNQLAPAGNWRYWLLLAGRGFGKTRSGAEWIRQRVQQGARRVALVGRSAADVRDVMVEGPSGILAVCAPDERPTYEPSKRRLTWPNGAVATTYSADEPDQLRGPEHDTAWADELAAWRFTDAWDQLNFGLRYGDDPRCVITTTPRPTKLIRSLLSSPLTAVTRGSTLDNAANLPAAWLDEILAKYKGTTLGRQELDAEILDDTPGALWRRAMLDQHRVRLAPQLSVIKVGVDPAASSGDGAADTGIIAAGLGAHDKHGYVFADSTCHLSPAGWGKAVVTAYHEHRANAVIAEANQGGEMVAHVIHSVDPRVPVRLVHASRSKQARAEPIAAFAEQGRIHHVGNLGALEDELCTWVPGSGESPNRLDACVWVLTSLMLGPQSIAAPIDPDAGFRGKPWDGA